MQRLESKQVLVDTMKQLVILTLRAHPMVNGHFYLVGVVCAAVRAAACCTARCHCPPFVCQ